MRYRQDEARARVTRQGSRLLVRWWSADHFEAIKVSFRAALPRHGDCCWNAEHSAWSVAPRARVLLERWLAWTFEPACVEWRDEEPAGYSSGRTYSRGRTSYGASQQQTSTSAIDAAYAELHLLPSAPAWAAEAVYRAAIKVHHPDAGGDGQTMTRINVAMAMIREHQEQERKAS